MRIDFETNLPCAFEDALTHVRTPRLLQYVAAPLVTFCAISPGMFPQTWATGTYWVSMSLFGVIPLGHQAIVISYPLPQHDQSFALRDNGHSWLIRRWDHLITIEATEQGTRYRDRVTVEAGLLTPFIWLFARLFYAHRQRRWIKLATQGFRYEDK